MNTPRYNTIDTTIRRALLGQGFEEKRYYVQAFINARRWYETEYVGGVEKAYGHRTAQLQVEIDRTAQLPDDFVEWDMLGVRVGQQVHNLLHNPALVAMPDELVARVGTHLARSGQPVGLASLEYQYTNCADDIGVACLVGYGYPYIKPGEFVIQRAERQLLVNSQVSPGTTLYLHYLSDDAPMGEGTQLHPLAEAWLEFYILGFLYEQRNPGLAAKYEARAEQQRTEYMQKRLGFQPEDVFAAMRTDLNWRR